MAYDVIIIGSGPGGYVTAVRSAQLGLKTAIVEKDTRLGGTCLLRGCIPTKSMLHSAELADHARHAGQFGINVGDVSVDLGQVLKQKDKVVQQNAGGVAFLMKKNKIDVHSGFGSLAGPGKVKVTGDAGETILRRATSSWPRARPRAPCLASRSTAPASSRATSCSTCPRCPATSSCSAPGPWRGVRQRLPQLRRRGDGRGAGGPARARRRC
ncbi:MAG: FAD-dependent oxidoreductase [bacterium]